MKTWKYVCRALPRSLPLLLAWSLNGATDYVSTSGNDRMSGREPAFSFLYNGLPSQRLLGGWTSNTTEAMLDSNRWQVTTVYSDPVTDLKVTCQATEYTDFSAAEWVLAFENDGGQVSPVIEQVNVANLTLSRGTGGEFSLDSADGCSALVTDFQPHQTTLTTNMQLSFAPTGGRSSADTAFPYFNVVKPEGGGEFLAVGWSGQWSARFTRDSSTNLGVQAGMQFTHLTLNPGEKIRTPSILVLDYKGSRMDGHNLFRRLLRAHYTPRPGGQEPATPIAASPAGYIGFNNATESTMIQAITNIACNRFPVDTFWIDAGWFPATNSWEFGTGNWSADPARFPHGMKPVADAAHANGMKFLLWFEPERVMPGTALYTSHPGWLLSGNDTIGGVACYLLNLGNPAALTWAETNFAAFITNNDIDIFRIDFNMPPLNYWTNNDSPSRQGMTEIRYITGLYSFLDYLQSNVPSLLIDNSSAAGHRLDLEMTRRSVPLLRTDYLWDPVGAQSMEYALSLWLPYQGQGGVTYDLYAFRSGMGDTAVYAFNYGALTDPWWAAGAAAVEQYKAVKQYFLGDFYPLTPYSVSNNVWLAYQFDRPDLGQGLVQAFRRSSAAGAALSLPLCALEPNARYAISNFDASEVTYDYGSNLLGRGLTVSIGSQPGAALITYQKD